MPLAVKPGLKKDFELASGEGDGNKLTLKPRKMGRRGASIAAL